MIILSQKDKMIFVQNKINEELDFELLENGKQNMHNLILEEFEDLLGLSQIKNIQNWFDSVNIPKTKVTDFKERIIETQSGKVLIGIRFLGMDISKPFINIWTSFPIEKELDNIIRISKKEFEIFKPKHIRFWSSPKKAFCINNQKHIRQNNIVGNIIDISSTKRPINYEQIELEIIENIDFYDWYSKMHAQFHKDNPKLKAFVSISPKVTFEKILSQKMSYFILFKGEKIGLIASEKDECLGASSIYMHEIIIDKQFKGLKLASASLRKLIELNKNSFTYIDGNIDSKNIPSTKNALKTGRKIISSEMLIPI